MGFFGTCVLWQGGTALVDVAGIGALGGDVDYEFDGASGWRFVRIHHAEHPSAEQVSAAATAIDGPLLMAYVVDSDFAEVQYSRPGHPTRRFVLHPDTAAGYGCPVDPTEQATAPADLTQFAGDGTEERQLRAAVAGRMVFAEDSVLWLAAALGAFPLADLAGRCFGDLDQEPDLRRAMDT